MSKICNVGTGNGQLLAVHQASVSGAKGYIWYKNGLLIQWIYDTGNTTNGRYLDFSIAFGNTNYALFAKSNSGNANESLQIRKESTQRVWINRNNVASTANSIFAIGYRAV